MSSAAPQDQGFDGVEIGPYLSCRYAGLQAVAFHDLSSPHGLVVGVRKNKLGFEIILPSWMNTDNIQMVLDRRDLCVKICNVKGKPIGDLLVLVEGDGSAYAFDPQNENHWVKIRRGLDDEASLVLECSNREWLKIYEYKNSFKIDRSGVQHLEIPWENPPEEFG